MSAEQRFDSFVVKQIKESGTNVRIFPLGELRALFDHGNTRSEPPYRLREFEAYIASANHDDMTWQTIEIERLDMGHRIRRGEPGNIGHRRVGEPRSRNTRSPTIRRVPPSLSATSTALGATKRPSPMINSIPASAVRLAWN